MATAYDPHDWVYKERITHAKLNTIEQGIAAASETAIEALDSVDEAIAAAETANTAAATAKAAAESAEEATAAIYSDKNFYFLKNSNGTVSLVYDDGE